MIDCKYTLFTEIPLLQDKSGKLYCDALWAKDLKLHIDYISNFSICCPVVEIDNPEDKSELEKYFAYNFAGINEISDFNINHIYKLRFSEGWLAVFLNFTSNFITVAKVAKNTTIAHSSGAGWPFPLSYYLLFIKIFCKFKWILVIESAFFLLAKDEKFNLRRYFGHYFHKLMLRACVKSADARIFVQEHYKNIFLNNSERALVAEATWLDSETFITESMMQEKLNKNDGVVKLTLVGRLMPSKGIEVLLNAITILETNKICVQIDIMGNGELEVACKNFIKTPRKHVTMSFVEPVPYGKIFFQHLSQYDALLLPSLSDEQPRIVFDAFSQGLCIIGSNTPGITGVCENNKNAIIFEAGSPDGLANAIIHAISNPKNLTKMGENGLNFARKKTHQQAHIERESFLIDVLKL